MWTYAQAPWGYYIFDERGGLVGIVFSEPDAQDFVRWANEAQVAGTSDSRT